MVVLKVHYSVDLLAQQKAVYSVERLVEKKAAQ